MNIGIAIGIPFQSKIKKIFSRDSFNRANNPLLGNTDSGQSWQLLSGDIGILNNQAYSTGGIGRSIVETNQSNCTIEFDVIPSCVAVFRTIDSANRLSMSIKTTGLTVYRTVSGTATSIGNWNGSIFNGDRIRIFLKDGSIQIYINGLLKLTLNETAFQTATKHGIGLDDLSGRVDNFIVKEN